MKRLIILLIFLTGAAFAGDVSSNAQKYTCPMHPHYIADAPGTCPICGMDLVPVETDQPAAKPGAAQKSGSAETAGRSVVTIAPEIVQNMGVRTIPAEMTVFGRTIRAFGAISENTRLQTVVASRVDGWIENLAVTAVGDTVKKGDLLFRLYSPDLIAAQQDFVAALRHGVQGRITSSARRLESLGVQKQTIEDLRQSRKAQERVAVRAEHDGVVARLNVREGTYVKPGDTLVVIQDYSSVWVQASVAEKDLALINENVTARLQFPSLPGQEIAGKVDYVHPTVDPQSRTGKVRLVLNNPNGVLRPGAYAHVVFDVEKQKRLAVPSEAILRDSRGAYVVKALGGGRFQPLRIQDGIVSRGRTEVLAGLENGEEVVVSGQFLIDSESALRESFHKLAGAQTTLAFLDLSPAELSLMDHVVDAALYLHDRLMNGRDITPDHLDAALQAGETLNSRFGETRLAPILEAAAESVRAAQKARSRTELQAALAGLTKALKPWLMEGKPAHYREKGLTLAADGKSGRLWLQQGEKLRNPFGGTGHKVPWPEEAPHKGDPPQAAMPKKAGTGHEHR